MRKLDPIFAADGSPIEDMNEDYLCAKLHLVDLAGSERAKRTGSDGLRFKEGTVMVILFSSLLVFQVNHFVKLHLLTLFRCSYQQGTSGTWQCHQCSWG